MNTSWRPWNPREIHLVQVEILPDGKEQLLVKVISRDDSMEGVLARIANFLSCLGYSIKPNEVLTTYCEENELILTRKEYKAALDRARKQGETDGLIL